MLSRGALYEGTHLNNSQDKYERNPNERIKLLKWTRSPENRARDGK
jgi:hypothetical protein